MRGVSYEQVLAKAGMRTPLIGTTGSRQIRMLRPGG